MSLFLPSNGEFTSGVFVEVEKSDGMIAGLECGLAGFLRGRMNPVIVDDYLSVYPKFRSIVARNKERVAAFTRYGQRAGEAEPHPLIAAFGRECEFLNGSAECRHCAFQSFGRVNQLFVIVKLQSG